MGSFIRCDKCGLESELPASNWRCSFRLDFLLSTEGRMLADLCDDCQTRLEEMLVENFNFKRYAPIPRPGGKDG